MKMITHYMFETFNCKRRTALHKIKIERILSYSIENLEIKNCTIVRR
jgi:hypothetical protein